MSDSFKQDFHSHSLHQSGDVIGSVDGGFPGRHSSGEHQPLLVEPGSHFIEEQGEVKLRGGGMDVIAPGKAFPFHSLT